jgi:hypothetical protein
MNGYSITIDGFSNPKEFVDKWSKTYTYKYEEKYTININKDFDETVLLKLMEWKNGTGDVISGNKMKFVRELLDNKMNDLKRLKIDFSFDEFELKFSPDKSSSIWKIFLLHILNPETHPIFDQHVYRSFNFFRNGVIEELPGLEKDNIKHKEVYRIYKTEYLPWFNKIQQTYSIEPRLIDKSLFSFGQVLKKLKGLPVTIQN